MPSAYSRSDASFSTEAACQRVWPLRCRRPERRRCDPDIGPKHDRWHQARARSACSSMQRARGRHVVRSSDGSSCSLRHGQCWFRRAPGPWVLGCLRGWAPCLNCYALFAPPMACVLGTSHGCNLAGGGHWWRLTATARSLQFGRMWPAKSCMCASCWRAESRPWSSAGSADADSEQASCTRFVNGLPTCARLTGSTCSL